MPTRKLFLAAGLVLSDLPVHAETMYAPTTMSCSDAVVRLVGTHFQLNYFAYPKEGMHPSEENQGIVITGVCRPRPGHKGQTISAFVYEANADTWNLLVALVDTRRRRIVATYKLAIERDATTVFHSNSLALDLETYQLARGVRAFALRENSFRERCTYDGGHGNDLTLFVVEKQSIRPVFRHIMSEWLYSKGDRCSIDGAKDTLVNRVDWLLSIGRTTTNGFADLRITSVQDGKLSSSSRVFQYNGCEYIPAPWTRHPCTQ